MPILPAPPRFSLSASDGSASPGDGSTERLSGNRCGNVYSTAQNASYLPSTSGGSQGLSPERVSFPHFFARAKKWGRRRHSDPPALPDRRGDGRRARSDTETWLVLLQLPQPKLQVGGSLACRRPAFFACTKKAAKKCPRGEPRDPRRWTGHKALWRKWYTFQHRLPLSRSVGCRFRSADPSPGLSEERGGAGGMGFAGE